MYNVLDIAAYIIYRYWLHGSPITNLKLQKILYYIQGYCLRQNNTQAFSERIYRWPYGPVIPEVYFNYNSNRAKALPEPSDECISRISKIFKKDRSTTKVINDVVSKSYIYTAAQMVEMTHREGPWMQTEDSSIISIEAISSYFSSHDPLNLEGK